MSYSIAGLCSFPHIQCLARLSGCARSTVPAYKVNGTRVFRSAIEAGGIVASPGNQPRHELHFIEIRSARFLERGRHAECATGFAVLPKVPPVQVQPESGSPPFHRSTAQPRSSGPPLSLPFVHMQLARKPALRGGCSRSGGRHVDRFAEPGSSKFDRSGPVIAGHDLPIAFETRRITR